MILANTGSAPRLTFHQKYVLVTFLRKFGALDLSEHHDSTELNHACSEYFLYFLNLDNNLMA